VSLTSSPFAAAFGAGLSLPPSMEGLLKSTKGPDARKAVTDGPQHDPFAVAASASPAASAPSAAAASSAPASSAPASGDASAAAATPAPAAPRTSAPAANPAPSQPVSTPAPSQP